MSSSRSRISDWPSSATPVETISVEYLPSIHVDNTILRRIRTLLYSCTESGEHLANLSARPLQSSSALTIDALYPISHPPPSICIPLISHLPPNSSPLLRKNRLSTSSTKPVPHLLSIFHTTAVCSPDTPLKMLANAPDIQVHFGQPRDVEGVGDPPRMALHGTLYTRNGRLIATGRVDGKGVGVWARDEEAVKRAIWIRAGFYSRRGAKAHRILAAVLNDGKGSVRTVVMSVDKGMKKFNGIVREGQESIVVSWNIDEGTETIGRWVGERILGDVEDWLQQVSKNGEGGLDKDGVHILESSNDIETEGRTEGVGRREEIIANRMRSVSLKSSDARDDDERNIETESDSDKAEDDDERNDDKLMEAMCRKYLSRGYRDEIQRIVAQKTRNSSEVTPK